MGKRKKEFIVRPTSVFFCGLVTLCLYSQMALASTALLEEARKHYQEHNYQLALKSLNRIVIDDQDPKRMGLIEVFRGLIHFEQKKYAESLSFLEKGVKLGTRLKDVSYFYIGKSHLALGDETKALAAFQKAKSKESPEYLNWKLNLEIAKIYFNQGKNHLARQSFIGVKSKLRGSEDYPEILWSLAQLDFKRGQKQQACYWAKELYKKYPTFGPISDWGLLWERNRIDERPINCNNSLSDQQDRIKRLQWMGASEKAYDELQVLKKSKNTEDYVKDMTMAEYLVNEGLVKEAFELLRPYYQDKEKKKDYDYISLLAKAASRAGEFDAAVGIYLKAYETFSAGKKQSSLYSAAFLSYQYQDYDGALRKFKRLVSNHPHSSLSRQANWYIPWIHYLKGNYKTSYKLFSQGLKNRRRKLPYSVTPQKLKYWMAMSQKRMGKNTKAKKLFLEITQDDQMGYYSIAAVHRLKSLVGPRGLASFEHQKSTNLRENWLTNLSYVEELSTPLEPKSLVTKTHEAFFSDWDSLPYMRDYMNLGQASQIYTQITKPEFRDKVERAKDMGLVGQSELAKWELYSIEGRTRNQEDLKTLMFEYHRNQVYHRASYIGTRHFAGARAHLGLHLGASLWHFVFPRAFEKYVLASGEKFEVHPEFIWSIMKAETNFRPDALSPVGAKGLMQVMTHTGRKMASLIGKTIEGPDLFEPPVGIEIGASYLKRNLKKFKGRIPLAAAAYNGGPHRVHAWLDQFGDLDMDEFIEHIPFLETRNYVKKVSRYYTLYNLIYNKNPQASDWLAKKVDVELEGPPPTQETWEPI